MNRAALLPYQGNPHAATILLGLGAAYHTVAGFPGLAYWPSVVFRILLCGICSFNFLLYQYSDSEREWSISFMKCIVVLSDFARVVAFTSNDVGPLAFPWLLGEALLTRTAYPRVVLQATISVPPFYLLSLIIVAGKTRAGQFMYTDQENLLGRHLKTSGDVDPALPIACSLIVTVLTVVGTCILCVRNKEQFQSSPCIFHALSRLEALWVSVTRLWHRNIRRITPANSASVQKWAFMALQLFQNWWRAHFAIRECWLRARAVQPAAPGSEEELSSGSVFQSSDSLAFSADSDVNIDDSTDSHAEPPASPAAPGNREEPSFDSVFSSASNTNSRAESHVFSEANRPNLIGRPYLLETGPTSRRMNQCSQTAISHQGELIGCLQCSSITKPPRATRAERQSTTTLSEGYWQIAIDLEERVPPEFHAVRVSGTTLFSKTGSTYPLRALPHGGMGVFCLGECVSFHCQGQTLLLGRGAVEYQYLRPRGSFCTQPHRDGISSESSVPTSTEGGIAATLPRCSNTPQRRDSEIQTDVWGATEDRNFALMMQTRCCAHCAGMGMISRRALSYHVMDGFWVLSQGDARRASSKVARYFRVVSCWAFWPDRMVNHLHRNDKGLCLRAKQITTWQDSLTFQGRTYKRVMTALDVEARLATLPSPYVFDLQKKHMDFMRRTKEYAKWLHDEPGIAEEAIQAFEAHIKAMDELFVKIQHLEGVQNLRAWVSRYAIPKHKGGGVVISSIEVINTHIDLALDKLTRVQDFTASEDIANFQAWMGELIQATGVPGSPANTPCAKSMIGTWYILPEFEHHVPDRYKRLRFFRTWQKRRSRNSWRSSTSCLDARDRNLCIRKSPNIWLLEGCGLWLDSRYLYWLNTSEKRLKIYSRTSSEP
eukprot:TRINITY_DN11705_c0_g1_i1.p1 TRINITY_DN11705_c0_g1~~TRINITY_DN11705_c0_g1_i1.p1  ORF type:complete len:885 (-),score=65.15 TRINITY_DN11705_c0_g1_i1:32-2686(-)